MADTHTTQTFSDAEFQQDVLESGQPVLVDFWAPWCGPCKMVGPVIEELATDFQGQAKVGKLNVDDNPKTAAAYGISSIPTVLIFQNGEVVDRFIGVQPKGNYAKALTGAA
ncbi:Thioredoxin [Planctomycetes bacterium Pan216]|uniref:Thioredoxin n=1 Tax=Kolteria novifilia TaxID=2527975 RepID=A0A518B011_9BACT|nr:Thioredoxin [Planctomycetes bacterium Pan216]